jgi:hypothetical protein
MKKEGKKRGGEVRMRSNLSTTGGKRESQDQKETRKTQA